MVTIGYFKGHFLVIKAFPYGEPVCLVLLELKRNFQVFKWNGSDLSIGTMHS